MQHCGDPNHTYEYLERWIYDGLLDNVMGTPLIIDSVIRNHVDCLKLLVNTGADVNMQYFDGETPTCIASDKGHYECLIYLLSLPNIDCGRSRMYCTSALDIAILHCHRECAFALIDHGLKFTKEHLYDRIKRYGDYMELPPIEKIDILIDECETYINIPEIKEPE
jgi:ankyrin repeat protein